MTPGSALRGLLIVGLFGLLMVASPLLVSAQQITYYTFDNAPDSYSYSCQDPAHNSEAVNPLLCLNNGTGSAGVVPSFLIADQGSAVGEKCGSGDTRCPYTDDLYHTALIMTTQTGSQGASVWFSVPQKIRDGFTSYFAFRFLPSSSSYSTGDGLAFVVQNANGSGGSGSGITGSGPNVRGQIGNGIGYGGIDHSLAIELDTYSNSDISDPTYQGLGFDHNSNHIAVQSCGSGLNNSNHGSGGCLVDSAINSALPAVLWDGNIHEVVIEYAGPPVDAETPNLFVYLDPSFVSDTHTPVAESTPVISVRYDLSSVGLLPSSCGAECTSNDSAYVGFTSSTGAAFEGHNLLAWTFTPHTPVTQEQPLHTDGTPTTFPFGDHTAGVTYPSGATNNIDMIVTAHTVSPSDFAALVAGGPFSTSLCQVYEGTGGNCVIYSISCVHHNDQSPVACPPPSDPNDFITFKTAYENTDQPISPGLLQGDPLRSVITTITSSGGVATVTCEGECPVTVGQAVKILNNSNLGYDGPTSVLAAPSVNTFTFNSTTTGSGNGGFVTSSNVQDICDPSNCYVPQRIDGTTTGRTKNFSDFVATAVTPPISFTSAAILTAAAGSPVDFPVTAKGTPLPTISVDSGSLPSTLSFSSGTISGTPGANTGGVYHLVFRASNGVATDVTQSFQLVVTAAPGITSLNNATFAAGTPGTFQVTASGYPVATFGISGGSLPSGVTLTPSGLLSSNASAPAGTYNFTLGATNTSGSDTQPFTLVISAPASKLSVTPNSLSFGDVYLGSRQRKTVTVKNISTSALKITKIYFIYGTGPSRTNYGYFTECGGTINPGKTCTIAVELHAQDVGPGSSQLGIAYNSTGSPALVALSGNVINPKAKLADNLAFGNQALNTTVTKTLILTNSGDTPLLITGFSMSGSTDFTQTNNCVGSLAKKGSCTISVTFKPTAKQSRTASLIVSNNQASGPEKVSLSGKGI